MATAKAGPRQTSRKVTLRLTEGEAELVLALASSTGGNLKNSPRKYAHRVTRALQDALGYGSLDTDAYRHMVGHTHFRNYDTPEVTLREHVEAFRAVASLAIPGGLPPEVEGVLSVLMLVDELVDEMVPA
jgi:hypothetical protein